MIHKVAFTTTVAGTVEQFDSAAFKTNLAAGLRGVNVSDISLTVTSGSVKVAVKIVTTSEKVADDTVAFVAVADTASLSALLGVTVTSFTPAAKIRLVLQAPPPSPPSDAGGLSGGVIAGIAVAAVAVVVAAVVLAVVVCKKTKATDASTKGKTKKAAELDSSSV